jgi:membrane-associated protein
MDWFKYGIDLILHLDKHLAEIASDYGLWTYLILFLIVFCETGLVVTPFLPGDSLLFAVGALAGAGTLNVGWLFLLLMAAAVLGDTVNYHAGHFIGERIFRENARILKKKHLDRTHEFFEKYGGKTIVIARFVPIVRTFAPFVAGAGSMSYGRFLFFNFFGALLWVGLILFAGYFFGGLKVVQDNFGLVVIAIIVISVLPMGVEYWNAGRRASTESKLAQAISVAATDDAEALTPCEEKA